MKFKNNIIWLVLVIIVGIAFRLRNFWLLPIDAHPMRQTDTECVAYFLAKGESSFLYPKACLMRPVSNTEGYFFLEMPFYEGLLAISYKIFNFSIFGPRLVNLILYLVATVGVYIFSSSLLGVSIGVISALLFSLSPASIFFVGHALHPDVFAVSMMAVSLAVMAKTKPFGNTVPPSLSQGTARTRSTIMLVISGIFLGLSVATRPFGLIVTPVYIWYLAKSKSKWWQYLIWGVLSLGFYGFWRWWTTRIGVSADWENWILAGREKLFDADTLFRRLIWINVSGEVIGKVISGLAVLGIIVCLVRRNKNIWPITLWILMIPVYWLIVPNGNLIHQYYGDVYIIPIVIVAAVGLKWILDKNRWLGLVVVGLVMYNGRRTSDYYFKDIVRPEKLEYAGEIEENIPKGSKILYLVSSDSVPVSLAHRKGWMIGEWPTDVAPHIWSMMEMRNFGINYFVEPKGSMDMKREDMVVVEENFPLYKETEHLRILKWEKR